jgi:hypothetical protein
VDIQISSSVHPFHLITKLYVPEALNVKLGELWNALPFAYVAGKIVAEETVDKSIVNGTIITNWCWYRYHGAS